MGIDSEDEAGLVQRCLAGDPSAFEPLVVRYHRPLFNLAARLLGNRDEALDSTQNAFVRAYEHLDTFDTKQRFFSWIYQIVRNECINVLRARRPAAPLPENLIMDGSPADGLEQGQRQAAIQAALMHLTDDLREVILLRHFTELSYRGDLQRNGNSCQDREIAALHCAAAARDVARRRTTRLKIRSPHQLFQARPCI
ncbi:MAG: sigma-70 family RNA polymerase sigma factor [Vicinamibacterales bacterium]